MKVEPLCVVEASVGQFVSLGETQTGERRMVPILGGMVSRRELSGKILPGGADWQTARADGVIELDAHYAFKLA